MIVYQLLLCYHLPSGNSGGAYGGGYETGGPPLTNDRLFLNGLYGGSS
jgi:hypothetical protein